MKSIELESEVGTDGVLSLQVPLGSNEARRRVRVTIEPLAPAPMTDWPEEYFANTFGALRDDPMEVPADVPLQPEDLL